jgi:thiamine pyrophosphate-dependent acetolactate synthase large subunit-like protein
MAPQPARIVPLASPPVLAAKRPPNVATAALDQLRERVNRLVPVVAGGNDMPLLEAAYALNYRPIPTRSELGAGFVANGIAWESGQTTLCLVITSVGVFGLMQALYAACVNRRPVVVISGEVAGIGCGSVQAGEGWDGPSVTQTTRALTAWSFDATTPDLAMRALRRGVALAASMRRPVHVNVSLAVQRSDAP